MERQPLNDIELWNLAESTAAQIDHQRMKTGGAHRNDSADQISAICHAFMRTCNLRDGDPLTAEVLKDTGWTWNPAHQIWWRRCGDWIVELSESWDGLSLDGWQCAFGPADGSCGGCVLPVLRARGDLRKVLAVFECER